MDTTSLKKLGLTDGEIKTYLCLIEYGRQPIVGISQRTKLNRTGLYDILDNLIEKGLVNYNVEEKKKYFKAAPPERIKEYLEEKEEELRSEKSKVDSLIKDLKKISPQANNFLNVEIYRGKKGIITVLEDVYNECSKGDEVLSFGFGGSNFIKLLGPYYINYIFKHVNDHKIGFRGLFNQEEKDEDYVKKLGKIPKTKAKFIFKDYQVPTNTRIYGDKVAIILVEKEPTAILISDKKVAEGYRYFFEFLWNSI